MFVVITGLDGSGTSSVAEFLHRLDKGSKIFRTPSEPFDIYKDSINQHIRLISPEAHYLFYLSSVVFASKNIEVALAENINVYCVRYLIDTVVSHRVAGLPVELEYRTELYNICRPDLSFFIDVNEDVRQERITRRGKGFLDKFLDDTETRLAFLREFSRLSHHFITISNTGRSIESVAQEIWHHMECAKNNPTNTVNRIG